jgi:tetratricopeptide (TPR) repeat protein
MGKSLFDDYFVIFDAKPFLALLLFLVLAYIAVIFYLVDKAVSNIRSHNYLDALGFGLGLFIIVFLSILVLLGKERRRLLFQELKRPRISRVSANKLKVPVLATSQITSPQITTSTPASVLTQEEINSLYLEGVELLKQGQPSNAIKKFNMIVKIDPDHAPTWNARAVAMEKMGNLDQAFISVVNALRVNPTEQKYLDNYHKLEKKLQNRR